MKLNKAGKSAVAVVLAVALALSGTFAWQSISQRAQNEMRRQVNPGGRLHDDYSGWEPGDTKDVYVENFGERPIFARVRLDEYMELGEDAGSKPAAGKVAQPLVTGAKIDDVTTWTTHLPASDFPQNPRDPATDPFHAYWDWTLGGQAEDNPDGVTVYMPTFNMNSDSLSADVNGSLKGSQWKLDADGNRIPFSDYVKYEEGDVADRVRDWTLADETGEGDSNTDPALFKVPNGAFIDADDDTVDEANVTITPPSYNDTAADFRYNIYGNGGTENTNYKIQAEQHTAKETETGTVITMEQYKALTDQQKKELRAWVYDADGWAYWSQPIEPGTATGLLLDRISLRNEPDESWYYAINAVGQFITADDLGRKGTPKTGFYADPNEEPSADAEDMLEFLGVDISSVNGSLTVTASSDGNPVTGVTSGLSVDLTAAVAVEGEGSPDQTVTYTLSGNTSADTKIEGNQLIVGADEPLGSILTITAESTAYGGLKGKLDLEVKEATYTIEVLGTNGRPVTNMVPANDVTLKATLTNSLGIACPQEFTWSLEGAGQAGTTIAAQTDTSEALLTVDPHETGPLTVKVKPSAAGFEDVVEESAAITVSSVSYSISGGIQGSDTQVVPGRTVTLQAAIQQAAGKSRAAVALPSTFTWELDGSYLPGTKVEAQTDSSKATLTCDGGEAGTIRVKVKSADPAFSGCEGIIEVPVTPTTYTITLKDGNTDCTNKTVVEESSKALTVSVTSNPSNAILGGSWSWKSSNTDVATVSGAGLVTIASGATNGQTATITATHSSGKYSARCTVEARVYTYTAKLLKDGVNQTNKTISVDGNVNLSVQVTSSPDGGTLGGSWSWSSSNTDVATVSGAGLVTIASSATDGQTATITATHSSEKYSVSCTVEYVYPIVKVIEAIEGTDVGSTTPVSFAGREWYVVAKNSNVNGHNAALLLSQDGVEKKFCDLNYGDGSNRTTNRWSESSLRSYLNSTTSGGFLNGSNGSKILNKAIGVTNGNGDTLEKVFILTEADVFGTNAGGGSATSSNYSTGLTAPVTINGGDKCLSSDGAAVSWWLRSKAACVTHHESMRHVAVVNKTGNADLQHTYGLGADHYHENVGDPLARPAFWFNLDD